MEIMKSSERLEELEWSTYFWGFGTSKAEMSSMIPGKFSGSMWCLALQRERRLIPHEFIPGGGEGGAGSGGGTLKSRLPRDP